MSDSSVSKPVPKSPTHVTLERSDHVVAAVVFALLGLLIGWGLPWLTGVAAEARWFPLQEPLTLINELLDEHGWLRWLLLIILPVVGVMVGLALTSESTTVRVADDGIMLITGEKKQRFARAQVSRVLLEGKELILRDERDVDLVREKLDVPIDELVDAMAAHDWDVEQS